jgi:hypothetical protein
MTKTGFLGSLALVLLAGTVVAQEPVAPADDPQQDEMTQGERANDPRPQIRVLENPYDLASYYRSSQGGGFLDYRPEGSAYQDRYPIASYYRLRSSGDRRGYAPFWTNGYGYSSSRPRFIVGFRRRIGQNGDLFLFAPTFLSPIGPLTDAFFGR